MKTTRDSRKAELEQQRDRINGELAERRPKLAALEARATELRDERAAGARSLALGALDEKRYAKLTAGVDDATARADGMRAVVEDANGALAAVEGELHVIAVAEAEEARAREVVAATTVAEASAEAVRAAFKALCCALGDVTIKLHDLAALDAPRATRIARALRNEQLVEALRDEGYVPLGITGDGGANVASAPAMVEAPPGDFPGSIPLAEFLRFRAAAARQPAETAEVA
ncbi:MAG: hypothetical protein ACHQQS_02885 [Thermoanaerobaculales bacterium]